MVKEEQESANRPDNTAFTQQRLPAWQPILSAGIIIPGFVIIGLTFIGIGVALFVTSKSIQDMEIDYTGVETDSDCYKCTNTDEKNCVCRLDFNIPTLIEGPVFFYYGLSNYFQNYRRYGVSKDDTQLSGDLDNFKTPSDDCSPYETDDTFVLYQNLNGSNQEVPFDGKGIAWWTDYNVKYRNPDVTPLKDAFEGTVKPPFWSKPAYELDPTDPNNNGFINQDFLVWMRRAALPDFRKLYRRISQDDYARGLPAGNYTLQIGYNYPVMSFKGKKKVVFSNVSWMGGRNEFLGIAYLVIGSWCIVMSIVMLIVYAKFKFPEED
ncbi:Cell cycle control protein 50B [Liparis tanakae]|uniref:Cell cycle control protein n=1 Tax=Liparis tanakae TaxID=230148 RepID=A0A4Z2H563_9TELE|nr:Cell cycle control protein 50B [Liparis tanakae]